MLELGESQPKDAPGDTSAYMFQHKIIFHTSNESLTYVKRTDLEGQDKLMIIINIMGEQQTRIICQSVFDKPNNFGI